MTGNESDAEDVVQESFMRAYRQLGKFDERATFGTWLYRIATNCSLDLVRSRKRRSEQMAAAETEVIFPRSAAMFPDAGRHVVPSAEVRTTGPGTPTAIHPAGPWVTVVSVSGADCAGRSPGLVTRVQDPPGACLQIAG